MISLLIDSLLVLEKNVGFMTAAGFMWRAIPAETRQVGQYLFVFLGDAVI